MELFIFPRFHARPGNEGAVTEALLEVIASTRTSIMCAIADLGRAAWSNT